MVPCSFKRFCPLLLLSLLLLSAEPVMAGGNNCEIPPPTTVEPTETMKQIYRCLRAMNYDPEGRLNCTNTDIKRPPECPPEKGSEKEDPTGYAICSLNEFDKKVASMGTEELNNIEVLATSPQGMDSGEISYLESLISPQALSANGASRSGAAWVECENRNPAELLLNALHEVCHLKEQCDRNKPISEIGAATCAGDRFYRTALKYEACRILIRDRAQGDFAESMD